MNVFIYLYLNTIKLVILFNIKYVKIYIKYVNINMLSYVTARTCRYLLKCVYN